MFPLHPFHEAVNQSVSEVVFERTQATQILPLYGVRPPRPPVDTHPMAQNMESGRGPLTGEHPHDSRSHRGWAPQGGENSLENEAQVHPGTEQSIVFHM